MLAPGSRYTGLEDTVQIDGKPVAVLRRRLLPQPEEGATIVVHQVGVAERLDRIAGQELGDPELFWRIADANRNSGLEQLVDPGRRLRIPLPPQAGA